MWISLIMPYGLILGASILLVVGNLGFFGWEFYLHTTKNLSIHCDKLPNKMNCSDIYSAQLFIFEQLYFVWKFISKHLIFIWKFIFERHKWGIEIFCGVWIKLSSWVEFTLCEQTKMPLCDLLSDLKQGLWLEADAEPKKHWH